MLGSHAARLLTAVAVVSLASCTGMLHEVGGRKDLVTTATFNMFTNSSYDTPTADWEALTTDDNFLYYECLIERTHQFTEEVTETGVWETCESPHDLRNAAGIDVEEGFNGQLTVRAVSRSGEAGSEVTKPFRRALLSRGVTARVNSVNAFENNLIIGGDFSAFMDEKSLFVRNIAALNGDGTIDLSMRGFVESFDGGVQAILIQDDGKILVGGDFTSFDGDASVPDDLIRLNADGTRDTTFNGTNAGFTGDVNSLAIQADGKIIVAGGFGNYNGVSVPSHLIRLNEDGSHDTSFNFGGSGFSLPLEVVAIQADGKILAGGIFSSFNGDATAPNDLIRLNSDGSRDTSFNGTNAGFSVGVYALAIQSDGKILVGGNFTSYNGDGTVPDRLVRLNSDGSRDLSFNGTNAGFDAVVSSIRVQDNGKLLVSGSFVSYNGETAVPDRLIRLNDDGSLDPTFNSGQTGFNGSVSDFTLDENGKILAIGSFTSYNGDASIPDRIARLNLDGSVDPTFGQSSSGFGASVLAVGVRGSDGKIFVGGSFSNFNSDSATPARLVRTDGLGVRDSNFIGDLSAGFDAPVRTVFSQSDGKILVGGDFLSFNGDTAVPRRLLRLNADGTRDESFNGTNVGFSGAVNTFVVQGDGKILVGGNFASYNGDATVPDVLIRLNSDGSRDTSFNGTNAGFNSQVRALALQADGKILVGGDFSSYNGDATVPDRLIRLNSDGSRDTTFNGTNAGFPSSITSIAIQTDGKILVAGDFTTYNGDATVPDRLIRLNADGSRDSSFNGANTGFVLSVRTILLQADGKVLVGGDFGSYNGDASVPDRLIRLNTDGSFDATFNGTNAGFNGSIYGLSLQGDGKVLVGGDFTSFNGDVTAPDRIIRLNSDGSIDPSFMGQRR